MCCNMPWKYRRYNQPISLYSLSDNSGKVTTKSTSPICCGANKRKRIAASVDRTQYLQKSHAMRDSSELQSGALPGELKRLIHGHCKPLVYIYSWCDPLKQSDGETL